MPFLNGLLRRAEVSKKNAKTAQRTAKVFRLESSKTAPAPNIGAVDQYVFEMNSAFLNGVKPDES